MMVYDILLKKRGGAPLSSGEIQQLVEGFTAGTIPDYQMSAFLMAACIRGLDDAETSALAAAMTRSGAVLDLSDVPGVKVDKHSTGGVGDGTSLVIAPLAACAGVTVPMMSGRSLGHTGGTLDKLESIPGFNVNLTQEAFRRQLAYVGAAMIGQTPEIAPADRKMYALRDVTATVDSIPLIAASIMSKKIAEGADALVLDVKTGSGAFMRESADARRLAAAMKAIGTASGKRMSCVITDMDRPLGRAVGNALEVRQAVDTLSGGGPDDFVALVLELTGRMIVAAGIENDLAAAVARAQKLLRDGSALKKFREIVAAQGGDPRVADDPAAVLPQARFAEPFPAPSAGYITGIDTRAVGMAAILAGAGRQRSDDRIDPAAGFILHKNAGDRVEKGEPILTMHCSQQGRFSAVNELLSRSYHVGPEQKPRQPLVREEI